jgi:hypothetical protein
MNLNTISLRALVGKASQQIYQGREGRAEEAMPEAGGRGSERDL